MKRKSRWMKDTLGILTGVFGALSILVGIAVYFSYLYVARRDVKRFLTIDSPEHPQYDLWVAGEYGANVAETILFAANITNADAFLNGSLPAIDFTGPYRYSLRSIKENIVFEQGGSRISYNSTAIYTFLDGSSNDETDRVFAINLAVVSALEMLSEVGLDDSSLVYLFAAAAFRKMARLGPQWSSNESLCYGDLLYGACSIAHYYNREGGTTTNLFASFGDDTIFAMMRSLSSPEILLRFVEESAWVQQEGRFEESYGYVWSQWVGAEWTVAHITGLSGYISFTGQLMMDAMQAMFCSSQSIMLLHVSVRDFYFSPDPFNVLLTGSSWFENPVTCFFCNGTSLWNTVLTGIDDESKMGTDYYLVMAGVGDSVVGRANHSVALSLSGRTHSLPPFVYEIPHWAAIRMPLIHRKVNYTFARSTTYRSLRAKRYELRLEDQHQIATDVKGAFVLTPFFGVPFAVTRIGLNGTGEPFESLWKEMCETVSSEKQRENFEWNDLKVSDLLGAPVGVFHAEDVSGFGVDNQFTGQLNVILNFSRVNNGSYLGIRAKNSVLGAQSSWIVPQTVFVQRSYANKASSDYLHYKLNELLIVYEYVLIVAVSVGAVLLASSMAWVAWDTHM